MAKHRPPLQRDLNLTGTLGVYGRGNALPVAESMAFGVLYDDGALATTEAQDTASLAAEIVDYVSLAATEAPDTAAVNVAAWHTADLAATEAPDTVAASVSNYWPATLAVTEAKDTASIAVAAFHTATLAVTEAPDTAAIAAAAWHNASLAATEAPDTIASAVGVFWPATLAATEAKDTVAVDITFTGTLFAELAVTEAPDTTAIAGDVFSTLLADIYITEAPDSVNFQIAKTFELSAISGTYTWQGYAARLYESSFFYIDSEVIYVPQEINTVLIDPAVVDADVNIVAAAEIQRVLLDFEDRLIQVPASDDEIEELIEYRQADAEARMRTT